MVFLPPKIFCPKWYGYEGEENTIVNISSIGEWNRKVGFIENPDKSKLIKLKGIVARYNRAQEGFIEVENCGLQVFYQPGKAGHFSTDVNKTKVEFYLGFNYNGARAFEVKNIE